MMDPTGGGMGKAAGELLKEMQQAQQELQKMDQQQGPDKAGVRPHLSPPGGSRRRQ